MIEIDIIRMKNNMRHKEAQVLHSSACGLLFHTCREKEKKGFQTWNNHLDCSRWCQKKRPNNHSKGLGMLFRTATNTNIFPLPVSRYPAGIITRPSQWCLNEKTLYNLWRVESSTDTLKGQGQETIWATIPNERTKATVWNPQMKLFNLKGQQ